FAELHGVVDKRLRVRIQRGQWIEAVAPEAERVERIQDHHMTDGPPVGGRVPRQLALWIDHDQRSSLKHEQIRDEEALALARSSGAEEHQVLVAIIWQRTPDALIVRIMAKIDR